MAIDRVQLIDYGTQANDRPVPAWISPTTAGSLLLAVGVIEEIGGDVTVTPPSGWTALVVSRNSGDLSIQPFGIPNAASRSGAEEFSLSDDVTSIWVLAEYVGLTTTPLDQEAGITGTGPRATAGITATTTQAYELWFGVAGIRPMNLGPFTDPTNGFVKLNERITGTLGRAVLEKIVTATGEATTQVTALNDIDQMNWAGKMMTFKAGARTYQAEADVDLFFDIESYASRSRRPERRSDYVRPHGPGDAPARLLVGEEVTAGR